MTPEYISANDTERRRLNDLLDGLTADDLTRKLPNGVSVAATLVHLAFWDEYALFALRGYQESGFFDSHTNFEALNAAVLELAAAVPDDKVLEMARRAAQAVDRQAAAVSPELAEIIQRHGKSRTLERAQHRRTHLDQIGKLLSADS